MQVSITLHLAVSEEGVKSAVQIGSGSPFVPDRCGPALVSPALAASAASVTQEVVEFAEYIASSTGEAS